jgi:hypothetical protein
MLKYSNSLIEIILFLRGERYDPAQNMIIPKESIEQNRINMFSKTTNKRQGNEINKPHVCGFCQKKFAR